MSTLLLVTSLEMILFNRHQPKDPYDALLSKKERHRRESKKLHDLIDKTDFEKNDTKALIIAAITTIVPVVLIAFAALYFSLKFLFKF